jgi:hypothetical protein
MPVPAVVSMVGRPFLIVRPADRRRVLSYPGGGDAPWLTFARHLTAQGSGSISTDGGNVRGVIILRSRRSCRAVVVASLVQGFFTS